MKASKFIEAIRGVPVYCALFKVTKVPKWLEDSITPVAKGDLLRWHNSGYFVTPAGHSIGLGPSYVQFVKYIPECN